MLNNELFKSKSDFGTEVMTNEEVLLYVKVGIQNGSSTEESYNDMKMIDNLLHAKRLHMSVHGHIKRTKNGHLRKGTHLYALMESIIEGRTNLK